MRHSSPLRNHSQLFQLAVDVLVSKSKAYIEVERVFDSKSSLAGQTIKHCIKVCIYFKSAFEFTLRRNKRLLDIENKDVSVDKLFGPLTAFISRCKDLLEICYTNQQFLRYQ